ncbi:MAG: isoprenylcysteine carboxylmethyltransferase family protein [Bacteroidales bacterium]|jgi:protein-S-isoprenylcysteine O-methyltransferase Ste14|nr:isoprenylcysteine carboxylmethyltransferase family protein [Bacteroidales bacterium]
MNLPEAFENQGNWLFQRRSMLPVTILVLGLLVYLREEVHSTALLYFCIAVSLFGLFIRCFAIGYVAPNTSGRNTNVGQVADTVNTTGIYSMVRHPLYLGNFFMWLGLAMITENFWFIIAFILAYMLYYERIMYAEENFMIKKFGHLYTDWAEKTPTFIPDYRLYVKPQVKFNWKKVLRQEKNGVFAVFLLFFTFDFFNRLISVNLDPVNYVLLGLAVASGIFYLVCKILKRKGKLDDPEN